MKRNDPVINNIINLIHILCEEKKYFDLEKNSIGKQLGQCQDLRDLISDINASSRIIPDFTLQLIVLPKYYNRNDRGRKKELVY